MKSALFTLLLLVGAAQAQQNFLATSPLPNDPSTAQILEPRKQD